MDIIGIDIGGTAVKMALVTQHGQRRKETLVSVGEYSAREELLQRVFVEIERLISKAHIEGIGIGSAGIIDAHLGKVIRPAVNLPDWEGLELKTRFADHFGLPVYVDNDTNVAALGEGWIGAARGVDSFVMLTLGTGVGSGVVINKEVVHGANWGGGEIGHVPLYPDGLPCKCGLQGCVEQYISGTALLNRVNEALGEQHYFEGKAIFDDYEDLSHILEPVLDSYVEDLCRVLALIQNTLDPQLVVLGGGIIQSKAYWWPKLRAKLQFLPLPIKVAPAKLGKWAGVTGAAYLVLKNGRNP